MLEPIVTLKKPVRIRPRHPWLYKSQIVGSNTHIPDGSLAVLRYPDGDFYARGYYNSKSEIIFRSLTFRDEPINEAWILKKIQNAFDIRKKIRRESNAYRLVASEGDELPGLIVDVYADFLVVQFLTAGIENLRNVILSALETIVPNRGIFEKSQSHAREIEGLDPKIGWLSKECGDSVEIKERDIRFRLDFGSGHKTGFYLDQHENRLKMRDLNFTGKALDCFCFSGGFSLHLAQTCDEVLGVDSQEDAVEMAKANQRLNQIDESKLAFRCANVFDALKQFDREKRKFNVIVLDPPSFVKRKDALDQAISGFKEIILRSMKLLEENGFLAVFSCSYHVNDSLLMQISQEAALDVNKNLKVVQFMKQSPDHLINPFVPETYYLKGFLFLISSLS